VSASDRLDRIADRMDHRELRDLAGDVRELEREVASLHLQIAQRDRAGRMTALPASTELDHDVRAAHRQLGSPVGDLPAVPRRDILERRDQLIREEYIELSHAVQEAREVQSHITLGNLAQEAVDLIYTTTGLLVECGVDLRPVWDLIHSANMKKRGVEGGKWQKPEGWRKPDIPAEITRQQAERPF
jgi:predicted HAD superfamily Cof-like phosphohydrolase